MVPPTAGVLLRLKLALTGRLPAGLSAVSRGVRCARQRLRGDTFAVSPWWSVLASGVPRGTLQAERPQQCCGLEDLLRVFPTKGSGLAPAVGAGSTDVRVSGLNPPTPALASPDAAWWSHRVGEPLGDVRRQLRCPGRPPSLLQVGRALQSIPRCSPGCWDMAEASTLDW